MKQEAEDTHAQKLAEANAQIEKLRGQLTALEASLAKGSGNEEAIKQLQQSLAEEKEKTDSATQQAELAEGTFTSISSFIIIFPPFLLSSFLTSHFIISHANNLLSCQTLIQGQVRGCAKGHR
jgi:hypothetical protein